ncbi:MAG: sigma-54-dependent transcriptional regulator [Polyangiales bacterium]
MVDRKNEADPISVLVVDDEPALVRVIDRVLTRAGFRTSTASSATEAIATIVAQGDRFDVVLTDLHLGDATGMKVLAAAKRETPETVVVVMTALATVPAAVAAIRAGAYDFLVKPFEPLETLVGVVARAAETKRLRARNRFLESKLAQAAPPHGIVGDSLSLRRLLSSIDAVAPVDTTILVLGESGTGKELVARAIHDRSRRADRPFLAVNCGALSESVLESELFGHVRGAFTGATASRRGLFEEASGGTLFLDEVGEMPPATQVRLLRVLESREVKPVGTNETRKVDVRVIAATNRNLLTATRAGSFREDLYYRLNVVSLDVPPLRDRADDIPVLVHHFVARFAERFSKNVRRLEPDAIEALCAFGWPGNIRELQNVIERGVLFAKGETISRDELPPAISGARREVKVPETACSMPMSAAIEGFEREYVSSALKRSKGNITEAARVAGVDRSNFRRILKRHGLITRSGSDDTMDSSDGDDRDDPAGST